MDPDGIVCLAPWPLVVPLCLWPATARKVLGEAGTPCLHSLTTSLKDILQLNYV